MRFVYLVRVLLKLLRRKFSPAVPEFCKQCGRNVHSFIAPDDVWAQVDPHIRWGHVLCYDCFCEICYRIGLPAVWFLR